MYRCGVLLAQYYFMQPPPLQLQVACHAVRSDAKTVYRWCAAAQYQMVHNAPLNDWVTRPAPVGVPVNSRWARIWRGIYVATVS